jgi:hypothetical protein
MIKERDYFEKPVDNAKKTEEKTIGELEDELFKRTVPPEYEKSIDEGKLIELRTPYAEGLYKELQKPENQEFLKKYFENSTVIDLGCGGTKYLMWLAEQLESKRYIGVDLDLTPKYGASSGKKPQRPLGLQEITIDDDEEIYEPTEEDLRENNILKKESRFIKPEIVKSSVNEKTGFHSILIKSDILNLVSRLKANSIEVAIISGIESDLDIPSEYLPTLRKEIRRILKKNGIAIAYHSDFSAEGLEKIREIEGMGGRIYEKQKSFIPLHKGAIEDIERIGINHDYSNAWVGMLAGLRNLEDGDTPREQTNFNIEKYEEYLYRNYLPADAEAVIKASNPERVAEINRLVEKFNTLPENKKTSKIYMEKFEHKVKELVYGKSK